jgi:hypothetical protein
MTDRPIIFSAAMVRALLTGRKFQTRRVLELPSAGSLCVEHGRPYKQEADSVYRPVQPIWCVGDRLWVRETWTASGTGVWTIAHARARIARDQRILFAADGGDGPWWSSIHMPREFSRLTLIIESVRVERLQDISHEDARAEGIGVLPLQSANDSSAWWQSGPGIHQARTAVGSYRLLWNSLHGPDAWARNPWVAVIGFDVLRRNIDEKAE